MTFKEEFLKDVLEGLTSNPKKLSSKYFYDESGDKLFHYIMNQPEYYLTCAEHEIIQTYRKNIVSLIKSANKLRIIEPGAGDGFKTRLLLEPFLKQPYEIIYNPIDISHNVLNILCNSMVSFFPELRCEPVTADYFHLKEKIPHDDSKKLMLFLGSNLGNFSYQESCDILMKFSEVMNPGDYFMLGVDMVKDPHRILAAYNDANGVTADFNFNLLLRINKELQANFNRDHFIHFPVYNPVEQQAESYLISKLKQTISIGQHKIHFNAWEPILTEISRKYSLSKIEKLANGAGFKIIENFFDLNCDFCCSIWEKG
jgi:dimethylhistidine N-methyltransferase